MTNPATNTVSPRTQSLSVDRNHALSVGCMSSKVTQQASITPTTLPFIPSRTPLQMIPLITPVATPPGTLSVPLNILPANASIPVTASLENVSPDSSSVVVSGTGFLMF